MFLLASGVAAQTPDLPIGDDFQANSYTTGNQFGSDVALRANGDFVVVWESTDQDGFAGGVFGQRFDSTGLPRGAEIQVHVVTSSSERNPSVASDDQGNFVVAWQRSGSYDGSIYGVFARRFDPQGEAIAGEFLVNTFTPDNQYQPAVASDAAGDFVVVWTSNGQDGSFQGVFAQRYDSSGQPKATEFRVNSYTSGSQWQPAVAMTAGGRFVVAWSSASSGDYRGISARVFDAQGQALTEDLQVNSYTTYGQNHPAVAIAEAGEFVVVWESYSQDGSVDGVFGQRFAAQGDRLGGEFQANTYTSSDQRKPSVALDAQGNAVVAWWSRRTEDDSAFGVLARRYDAAGQALGAEFPLNSYTTTHQIEPVVAAQGNGDFLAVWTSASQDSSNDGVFGRRFATTRVTGRVFADLNRNGLEDSSEPGVPDVTVLLVDDAGETLRAALTGSDGTYRMTAFPPGSAAVAFVELPQGATFTTQNVGDDDTIDSDVDPIAGQTESIQLEAGQETTDLDAGLLLANVIFVDGFENGDVAAWSLSRP